MRRAFDPATFRWRGAAPQDYKFALGDERGMGWRGVTRFTLAGPPALPARWELRYFELLPGGYSSLERHRHAHAVVVLRGRGEALVGDAVVPMVPFDLIVVPPEVPHRWVNTGDEPLGFLCPVDAERDAPRPVSDAQWAALAANPLTARHTF
jgi:quercetin dioxygenase-like cupin family protein